MLQELECRNCGRALTADDIDPHTGLVSCSACGTVYVYTPPAAASAPAAPARPPAKPADWQELERGDRLQIAWRWERPGCLIIGFALFWNGFMATWYTIAIANRIWLMALFGVLHLGVGIFLLHGIVCGFLNRTFVRVGRRRLEIRHLPVWAPGSRRVEADRIEELTVEHEIKTENNATKTVFKVIARLDDNQKIELVGGLADREAADYLVYRLTPYLTGDHAGRL